MGTLPRSTQENIFVPDAEEILEDTGLSRGPKLVWGSESDALAEIGRWIEQEVVIFEDDTNQQNIYDFYYNDADPTELTNALKLRIKKAICERVKVRCFAKALAVAPESIGWENLWKEAKRTANQLTLNLIKEESDGTTHEKLIPQPDRFPRALGPTYTGEEGPRTLTDGKDRLVFDTTVEEGDDSSVSD